MNIYIRWFEILGRIMKINSAKLILEFFGTYFFLTMLILTLAVLRNLAIRSSKEEKAKQNPIRQIYQASTASMMNVKSEKPIIFHRLSLSSFKSRKELGPKTHWANSAGFELEVKIQELRKFSHSQIFSQSCLNWPESANWPAQASLK